MRADRAKEAVAALKAGRFDEAARMAAQAYQEEPDNVTVLQVLGATAGWRGDHRQALQWFDRALRLAPGQPTLELSRAAALGRLGRFEDAVDACERAAARAPGQPFILLARANALRDADRREEAEDGYRQVLAIDAQDQKALLGLAGLRFDTGDIEAAAEFYRQAAVLGPSVAASYGLALCAHASGDDSGAETHAREAMTLSPGHPGAPGLLVRILLGRARSSAALAVVEDFRNRLPGRPEPLRLQAEVASLIGDAPLQARVLQELLEIAPGDEDARFALARLQLSYGDGEAAESTMGALRASARRNPAVARFLGEVCKQQGRLADAQALFERALALAPDDGTTLLAACRLSQEVCDWDRLGSALPELRNVAKAPPSGYAWYALSLPLEPAEQAAFADATAARIAAGLPPVDPANPAEAADGRLTIGYLTPDVREHPSMHLAGELFGRHDRERFRVLVYSVGPPEVDGKPWTERVREGSDGYLDAYRMSDEALADRIRGDGVQVLVDAAGHTLRSRQGVLARRPAPVQVGFMAYPGSVRAPWIDYIVADETVLPGSLEPVFSEKPLYMPVTYLPTQLGDSDPDPSPSRDSLGLPEEGFVLACFCNHYKWTPAAFESWMQVLQALPGAVLWLLDGPELTRRNLRAAAQARGVDPERLVFAPRLPRSEHLARLGAASLAVDTEIYGGHTTTVDCLWAGLPVVARLGEGFAARVAASLLRAAGLPELVTSDWDGCRELCLSLARDPERLAGLRAHLEQRRQLPLFRAEQYVRSLEDGFLQAWDRHRAGESPATIVARSPG